MAIAPSGSTLSMCLELEHLLVGDLCELLDEPLDATNLRWINAILDVLLDTLPAEMKLADQEGGYLNDILCENPNWDRQVDSLRAAKTRLELSLLTLRRESEQLKSPRRRAEFRRGLRHWIEAVESHHRAESDLLQNAMNWDIGCGD